jgi:hypothetical protein
MSSPASASSRSPAAVSLEDEEDDEDEEVQQPAMKKKKVQQPAMDVIDLTGDDDTIAPASLPPAPSRRLYVSRPAPIVTSSSVPVSSSSSRPAAVPVAPAAVSDDSEEEVMPRDDVPQYTYENRSIFEACCGCGAKWTCNTRHGVLSSKTLKAHPLVCNKGVDPSVVPRADADSYNKLPKQGARPELKRIRDHFSWTFISTESVQEKKRER